ncbi:MAG: SIMPL domain-containing protein [Candidatus Vogelbacteria bacterium]|nr:SIMPL domain-containing protein [Candidatus Vogelbacteria bacterium]
MNDRTKNYLGWAIVIAVLASVGALWSLAQTYSKSLQPSAYRSFSVSGQGKVVARPDVAMFTFSIINEGGTDIAVLERDNTARGNKINSWLKEQGVADKDIKTEQYNLSPRYQNTFCRPASPASPNRGEPAGGTGICPPPSIVGYTVTQSVGVKVRDFAKIGAILSGVVERGANNVSQLNFTIDDPIAVENEARTKAIAEAREKAKIVAKAGGFRLGRLLGIDEGGPTPVYAEKFGRMMSLDGAVASAPLPAPTIEPGSQEVVVNVTLRYEID